MILYKVKYKRVLPRSGLWFAWYPVTAWDHSTKSHVVVWLQTVYRDEEKGYWEYSIV